MKVYFFIVRPLADCSFDIKGLHAQFGKNIPMYLPLEGGPETYLFCLALNPYDVLAICRKNNYEVVGYSDEEEEKYKEMFLKHAFYEKEIDADQYNSTYKAQISYTGEGYTLDLD